MDYNKSIKIKTMSSLFWKLMERGGVQGLQFIIQIVLARLLLPSDYGLIAIVTIFIALANVFVQNGFNTALIQKKEVDEVDFCSVFYLSLFIAGILYITLYFISPYIAEFYQEPQIIPVLRVLSITLFLGAINSINNAVISRNMIFKKLFFSSVGSSLISGVVGTIAAFTGLGIWSLVLFQLTNQLSITIILWFTVKWRPKLLFSFDRLKTLFSYGWKLLISSLLDTLYMEIRGLIIGKIYSSDILAFYNRGQAFPNLIIGNIVGSIQTVLFPVLASQQDNNLRVKAMVRRSIVTTSFIIFPMMVGLAVVAESVVKILLTDKWLPAVPFLQIFCVSYALWPIHTANLQAINALGRSDIFLKLEITKKFIGFIILGISLRFGVYGIALGQIISGIISTFINAYPNKQLLDYGYKEQWIDIMPSLLIATTMGGIVYSFNYLSISVGLILVLQVVVGAVVYIGLAKVFKLESYSYLIATIREIVKGRKVVKRRN